MLKAKGYFSKVGIGYTPPTLVHMPIQKASVSVITVDVEEEEKSSKLLRKPSVFDRIGRPTSQSFVFNRLGTYEDNNFVVDTQGSVLTRLKHLCVTLSLHVLFLFSLYAHASYLLYAIFYFRFTLRCSDEFCLKCFKNTSCQSLSCHELPFCKVFQEFVLV